MTVKTAREQLFEEVTGLLGKSVDAPAEMKKLMGRYRVQTKPGIEIGQAATARDALGDRLSALVQTGVNDEPTRGKIGNTIDEFRMQLKQAGGPGEKAEKSSPSSASSSAPAPRSPLAKPVRSPLPALPTPSSAKAPAATIPAPASAKKQPAAPASASSSSAPPPAPASAKAARPSVTLGVGDPPGRLPKAAEPVAGGPRARKKARAECPKCHSMGVVLARSYSGDEYYSCIYCGWQAFKPADEDDPNASLALRLLGQTAGTE